jgi:hypothetical protein
MDYEVTCNSITVSPCHGADADGALHENRRQWPQGSVVRLDAADAESLAKAGAVKAVAPTKAQAAMAAAATSGFLAPQATPPPAATEQDDLAFGDLEATPAPRTRGTRK